MNKRFISAVISLAMLASAVALPVTAQAAEAKTPQYQTNARQMEDLNRGLIAVKTTADTRGQTVNGVYLSWRLLGTESLENQAFDIYRNDQKIHTTGAHDATNWIDTTGTENDKYKVVKAGADASKETEITPSDTSVYAKPSEVGNGNSAKHSYTYMDIPIVRPEPVARMGDGKTSYYYKPDTSHDAGANDASVGDLDGDGDYEIVLKWDPVDSKDSAGADYTGNVYIDAYEIDPNNGGYMWRIDLGNNVTAGAHYTQFMVYDFDGDGKAEVAMKTAPGSKDGLGRYVSEVGDTEEIRNVDNEAEFIGSSNNNYLGTGSSRLKGKNPYTQYLTIFDGETGAALYTTEFIPYETAEAADWGDGGMKYNRSERYLAAVAYLDGVHPSLIMCRGMYNDSVLRAYDWDGTELTMRWQHVGKKSASGTTLYGQGNHNLSVGDIDNDGKDEIVYGSAALDDDGKTVLGNTKLGHGDAMHMNDFNNDGKQEVFSVKEDAEGWYNKYAEDLRNPATGDHFWEAGKICWTTKLDPNTNKPWDNGRGVMDNIDDAYALAQYKAEPKNDAALALSWSSGFDYIHDMTGNDLLKEKGDGTFEAKAKPNGGSRGFDNSLVYWDGDLGRELLDDNLIGKYDAENGWTKRFYGPNDGYTLVGGSSNNFSKRNASLSADLWGDWREEVILPVGKGENDTPVLRIYTSTVPTDYRLTTLMHDSQYRLAIAWQNVGYNQPPHTSYYIGSAALATDEKGNELNYLAPKTPYTKVTTEQPEQIPVQGVEITNKEITLEQGKTATIDAVITPENATKKSKTWTTSDASVATVSNGVVKAVAPGKATITVTTKDGNHTDTCEVTVFATPVTGVGVSEKVIELGIGNKIKLAATVYPDNATDKSVTWTSEDTGVAAVAADGTVTGVGYGKTNVVVTTENGKTATCIVKVKPMSIVDSTGEDEFISANTDAQTTLSLTATSAKLDQNMANEGAEAHKDFTVYSDNTATLEFRLVTGGVKGIGKADDWNWTGHEYTMGIKLLDEQGNNILHIYQPYSTKATDLMSVVTGGTAQKVTDTSKSGWKNSGNVAGNIQGSAKRWKVKAEFDYDSDTCTVTVTGTGSDWVTDDGVMTQTFPLNGANFKTLSLYTQKDGEGGIKAVPDLTNVSYTSTEKVSGNTDVLYERGTDKTAWAEGDLTDWTQTGAETAALALDAENGRILYNPTKPGAEYSAKKTFDVTSDTIVSYDVDWYFSASTGRNSNANYIQFGDALRLGAMTDGSGSYYVLASTDGGENYDGKTTTTVDETMTVSFDETKAIWKTDKNDYTKNVKVIFDQKTNTIKSLMFDGKTIAAYTNYQLPDGAAIDSVSFGFTRGGGTSDWNYPNGIDRIRVSQFIEGEEAPDINCIRDIAVDKTDVKKINFKYGLADEFEGVTIIAALYNNDGELVEVKTKPDASTEKGKYIDEAITFDNEISKIEDVKVFIWNSIDKQQPVAYVLK